MYYVVIPRNWIGKAARECVRAGYQLPVEAWPEPIGPDRAEVINVYAYGDPREREDRKWVSRAKLGAALLIGLAGGYFWALLQGVVG